MTKTFTKTIAGFMTLWLSGVLFLFCGQMSAMEPAEFCPFGKGKSHCDKAKAENDSPLVSKESSGQKLDCCGFLPAVFDKNRKVETQQKLSLPADKVKIDLPKFVFVKNDFGAFEDHRSQAFSHQKIFIKNCVFRI